MTGLSLIFFSYPNLTLFYHVQIIYWEFPTSPDEGVAIASTFDWRNLDFLVRWYYLVLTFT